MPYYQAMHGLFTKRGLQTGLLWAFLSCWTTLVGQAQILTLDGNVPITSAVGLPPGGTIYLNAQTPGSSPPVTSYQWQLNGQPLSFTGARLAVVVPGTYSIGTCAPPAYCQTAASVLVVASSLANGQLVSYSKSTTVAQAGVTTGTGVAQLSIGNYQQQTTYADDLGRGIESVQAHAAPGDQDLVSFQAYDAAGNAPLGFLPYARPASATTYLPLTTLRNEQTQFYTATDRVASDDQPYTTTLTEASPLGRVQRTQRAGDFDNVHQRQVTYQVNEAADQVHRWALVAGPSAGTDGSALYAAGELSKAVTTDEDGRVSISFQDQLGRVVLKRTVNPTPVGPENLDTYSVYDQLGRQCYLVPPAAVARLASAGQWAVTDPAFISRWLYVYTYDGLGRLVTRQFPGARPVALVYDAYDRPILTQDGNQFAAGKWSFVKFDAQNRPIMTGLYASGSSAAALQAQVDASTLGAFEERTTNGYTLALSFPSLTTTGKFANATLLTQSFYDDYDVNGDGMADYVYSNQSLGADEPTAVARTRGLVTVQKTRIVRPGGVYGDWLTTALFYDQYDNLVQKRSNNHLNLDSDLPDVTTLVYREHGFVAQILRSVKAQRPSAAQTVVVRNRFAYDHAGRLLRGWQQNERNGTPEPEVLVVHQNYNALGQLVEKNLHSTDGGIRFLQSVDLAYDINGQLTGINNSALANRGAAYDDSNDVFGMEFVRAYDVPGLGNAPRYDGALSAVRWKVHNPGQQTQPERERSYRFAYDGAGRLTDASYAATTTPGQWTAEAGAYDERGLTYDPNGNLKTLTRYTKDTDAAPRRLLDQLQYDYGSTGSNQLKTVTDLGNATQGFRDQGTLAVEYPVDDNGNVKRDDNKGVDFVYNALNKVERQQTAPGHAIAYDYAADGTMLHRAVSGVVQQGTTVTKTYDYIDGFVYEGLATGVPVLASVPTSEGRALALRDPAPQPDAPLVYEYHLRDHLGNLRVAFRAQPAAQLHLTMEAQADEEGDYPFFHDVAATRNGSEAQEQAYSAAVVKFQTGPNVRLPATDGDAVKIDLFYRTPNGVQVDRPAPPPAARSFPVQLALAPVLLPAPGRTSPDARTGPAAWWPGLQFSLSGLLAGRAARQPRTLAVAKGSQASGNPPPPSSGADAYVSWNLLDDNGTLLSTGRTVLPVTDPSTREWDHATVILPVNLSGQASRTGFLEVYLLNDGRKPVYYDSVTIRATQPVLVISQENHYYPFGMNLKGVAVTTSPAEQVSKAQYNGGSELQDELLDEGGVYSTPYRTYDPALGRFQGVDMLADAYADQTPYQFACNDPSNLNDPTGAYDTDGFGHVSLKGGRGQDSFGFAYSNAPLDPSGNGLGMGLSSFMGVSTPWNSITSSFAKADTYFDQQWLARTGLSALNAFVPGLNAGWDSNHNSIGYYADAGWVGKTTNQSTMLAEVGVGVRFNSLQVISSVTQFLSDGWHEGFIQVGEDRNENINTALTTAGAFTDIADVANSHATLQVARSFSTARTALRYGNAIGHVGNALSLVSAGYEYLTGQHNTHTLVGLAVTGGSILAVGMLGIGAAPAVAAVGLVYGIWSASGGDEWIDKNWGYR